MRKITQVILVGGLFALTINTVLAQTTHVVLRTYFVLKGLEQGDNQVLNVRITNKDVLAALNATGNYHFGSGAQLVLISTEDQLPVIRVRETNSNQVTTTDVGAYFGLTDIEDEVHGTDNLTSWAYWAYNFDNAHGTDFKLTGLTTVYRGPITAPFVGTLTRTYNAGTAVYGAGGINGTNTVFSGFVYGGFPTIEVD